MSKYKSKSGLPEALGSHAHVGEPPRPTRKVSEEMCYIDGCKSVRTNRDITLPDGTKERLYDQGKGDVVIRTKDGHVRGYVCQFHYQKILDEAGKDQLSEASRAEDRTTQNEMPMRTNTPHGLLDNLTKVQHDLEAQRDEQLAAEWSQRIVIGVDLDDWDPIRGKIIQRVRHED